ncbi:hypothetical protein [Granulibacter bethesdensis]|uniref:hypothetical protein n=1 Tax=Granulibacter bethesdensis TaxID=364410 RepID=UPI0012FD46E3|nr:hypothetical protein [Granulibacter bethesdensis]
MIDFLALDPARIDHMARKARHVPMFDFPTRSSRDGSACIVLRRISSRFGRSGVPMSPDQQSQKLFEIADALDKGSLMLNAAEMVLDALPEHRARNAIAALLSDIAAKLAAQLRRAVRRPSACIALALTVAIFSLTERSIPEMD